MRQHLIDVWTGVEQSVIDDGNDQSSDADVFLSAFEPPEDILIIFLTNMLVKTLLTIILS